MKYSKQNLVLKVIWRSDAIIIKIPIGDCSIMEEKDLI